MARKGPGETAKLSSHTFWWGSAHITVNGQVTEGTGRDERKPHSRNRRGSRTLAAYAGANIFQRGGQHNEP
jgi:hypothetical protein